jgi:hypothetical protein
MPKTEHYLTRDDTVFYKKSSENSYIVAHNDSDGLLGTMKWYAKIGRWVFVPHGSSQEFTISGLAALFEMVPPLPLEHTDA